MAQHHNHSMIFAGKWFVLVLSLSSMCLLYDCNWLIDTEERWSYLVDFDKNETENEELEIEFDKYVKGQNSISSKQIPLTEKLTTIHLNIPISLYPDVTTPPPERG